jgi:hypothetical protein
MKAGSRVRIAETAQPPGGHLMTVLAIEIMSD